MFASTGPAFNQFQLKGSYNIYKTHIINTCNNFNKNIQPFKFVPYFFYLHCTQIVLQNTSNELQYNDVSGESIQKLIDEITMKEYLFYIKTWQIK